jgi:hypothetical protein
VTCNFRCVHTAMDLCSISLVTIECILTIAPLLRWQ